jgi:hydrogenase maturation protein HypF
MDPDDQAGLTRKPALERVQVRIRGAVQGVGFRPFVFRVASELGLAGFVNNSAQGVLVEIEGQRSQLDEFLRRLDSEKPPRSAIQGIETTWLEPIGLGAFAIRTSDQAGLKTAIVLPEIATCEDCLREIFDSKDRRYLYPFTNCTNCGPRFTIIEALPYDRSNTSMKAFKMCPQCQSEYNDPLNRRFHAQPNACHACGPHVELWDEDGNCLGSHSSAFYSAAEALENGQIVAVKGLGGFHLLAAAHRNETIHQLRVRKGRQEKPFALMFGSVQEVKRHCKVDDLEERLLLSPAAPIVLLHRKRDNVLVEFPISDVIAPGNPCLGIMLAYSPLHHLLLRFCGFPVVATSGNLAEEPICIDEHEAIARLRGIADYFLVHNRPIIRHADDSIARVMAGSEMVLRRARGYAPLPVLLKTSVHHAPVPILAVGAHLKNSVALSTGNQVFISQHIGDLDTTLAFAAFERVAADLERFYEVSPAIIAADAHPDYLSTQYACRTGRPVHHIQHHYAHVLSCMAEHGIDEDVLGVSWDGTGWGSDGSIWGGEFLDIGPVGFERFAHLRTFRLPGGEIAIKEPRRSAIGMLYECYGEAALEMAHLDPISAFSEMELSVIRQMLVRGLNAPITSSAGRVFDAAAALLGFRQRADYEGQAAMDLEFAVEEHQSDESYPIDLSTSQDAPQHRSQIVDWAPMLCSLLDDQQNMLPAGLISTKFHNSLAEAIVIVARKAGRLNVVLSGGCFQNKYLSERAISRLRQEGFRPFWHRLVPPNDGGIALGQVAGVLRQRKQDH